MRQPPDSNSVSDSEDPERSNSELEELLVEVLEGGDDALERVVAQRPELAAELRRCYDRMRRFGLLDSSEETRCVGPFVLGEKLGEGGMGEVYRARNDDGVDVALKMLRPGVSLSESGRERFDREARVLTRLDHASLPRIVGHGDEHDTPWLALEYVDGLSLKDLLEAVRERTGTVPPTEGRVLWDILSGDGGGDVPPAFAGTWEHAVLSIARDVAMALAHAHEYGIVHRDVKPANILLRRGGGVVLIDFGLALDGVASLTETGGRPGSLRTMPPEQWVMSSSRLDGRADIYSLGATIYELLTARAVFAQDDVEELRQAVLSGRHEPLEKLGVAADVSLVIEAALAPERELRTADIGSLVENLDRLLAGEKPHVERPPVWRRFVFACRRHSGRVTAACVVVVLGLAAVIAMRPWNDGQSEVASLADYRDELLVESTLQQEHAELLAALSAVSTGKSELYERGLRACSLRQAPPRDGDLAASATDLRTLVMSVLAEPDPSGSPSPGPRMLHALRDSNRPSAPALWLQRAFASDRLASLLSQRGDFVEAHEHWSRSVVVYELLAGPGLRVTWRMRHALARCAYRQGHLADGLEGMEFAQEGLERLLGAKDPSLVGVRHIRALAQLDAGMSVDEAAQLLLDNVATPVTATNVLAWLRSAARYAELALDAGDLRTARLRIKNLVGVHSRHDVSAKRATSAYIDLVRARLRAQRGRFVEARDILCTLEADTLNGHLADVALTLHRLREHVLVSIGDPKDQKLAAEDARAANELLAAHPKWLAPAEERIRRLLESLR